MKKVLFIVLMLLATTVSAGEVLYDGVKITFNDKYSGKDFSGQSFLNAKDLDGLVIYASVFYQEGEPDKVIFPANMENVTFLNCNLDNVYIDTNKNGIVGGTRRKIKAQNDLEDWILDKDLKPVEPMSKSAFIELNISTDSKDIPINKKTIPITVEKKNEQDGYISIVTP